MNSNNLPMVTALTLDLRMMVEFLHPYMLIDWLIWSSSITRLRSFSWYSFREVSEWLNRPNPATYHNPFTTLQGKFGGFLTHKRLGFRRTRGLLGTYHKTLSGTISTYLKDATNQARAL